MVNDRGGSYQMVTVDAHRHNSVLCATYMEITGNIGMSSKFTCPECGFPFSVRVRRNFWQRMLPLSECFYCRECGKKYLILFGVFRLAYRE
jgi:ribosomal protein L37E